MITLNVGIQLELTFVGQHHQKKLGIILTH